jgi:ferredoxin-NADP reductase
MADTFLTARLLRSRTLSEQTRHLEFEVEGVPRFDFLPGQFISLVAQHDGREITRAYSLASAPRGNRFDLCLNRVAHGFFSNYLCDLKEGGAIPFQGPLGFFTLRQPLRDSLLIATGTGIAPIRGMLQWLFEEEARHQGHDFWLVFGVRYRAGLYYHKEWEDLARRHPNFHYLPTLSREGPEWKGARGYVQEHVRALAAVHSDRHAYICGLKAMVDANRALLKELGWERKSIVYEKYD